MGHLVGILITVMVMDYSGVAVGQYPNCAICPNGECIFCLFYFIIASYLTCRFNSTLTIII